MYKMDQDDVEYLQGLTGEQFTLWRLHYKLGLQQHIGDKVFFAQINDLKMRITCWDHVYEFEQLEHDRQKQIYKQMELFHDAAEACK